MLHFDRLLFAPLIRMSFPSNISRLEAALEDNLSLYITPNALEQHNFFQVTREVSIARLALSQQAIAYQRAIELLLEKLEQSAALAATDPRLFTDIMTWIAGIENKSKSLIASAREVTELIGKAVNIDIDKSALRTLLANVPSIIKQSVDRISTDPELSDRISLSVSNQINDLMITLRLNREDVLQPTLPNGDSAAITIDQVQGMFDSVPTQPERISHE